MLFLLAPDEIDGTNSDDNDNDDGGNDNMGPPDAGEERRQNWDDDEEDEDDDDGDDAPAPIAPPPSHRSMGYRRHQVLHHMPRHCMHRNSLSCAHTHHPTLAPRARLPSRAGPVSCAPC